MKLAWRSGGIFLDMRICLKSRTTTLEQTILTLLRAAHARTADALQVEGSTKSGSKQEAAHSKP